MAKSTQREGDWLNAWFDQQRELLRQQVAQGGASPHGALDVGARWLEAGHSYLEGLAAIAQQDGDGYSRGFRLNDELLNAWRDAWTSSALAGEGVAQRFADLLGRLPPIGLAREQTESWRELAAAQVECRRLEQELQSVLTRVQAEALALLEERVRGRSDTDAPIATYRDLYDLWVECGEQVYAKVAHSESYAKLQAELGNATMRLRARQQKVLEHALQQFDLPTRSELNSVHLKLRELREQLAALQAAPGPAAAKARPHTPSVRTAAPARRAKAARKRGRR